MRFRSTPSGSVQIFAVAGTNTVSFGIAADSDARKDLLGFGVERVEKPSGRRSWVEGYKVFASLIPHPDKDTRVSTHDHPIQSLVWDDFAVRPDHTYEYVFHPLKGDPAHPDRTTPAATITVTTEPLWGETHDIFFNRGVTSSQHYATSFKNLPPEEQPTKKKKQDALDWLSRDLDEAILRFIRSAKPGDALRGCFYEFDFKPVLLEFRAAVDRGVDVKLVIDEKVNEAWVNQKQKDGTTKPVFVKSSPRTKNLEAIGALDFPDGVIIPREARPDAICHNKFMVLVTGPDNQPSELWTGSTNLTDGGVYGQANVGHWLRDVTAAGKYLDYWNLLATDPGATNLAKKDPKNAFFLAAVEKLTPVPPVDDIAPGVTPLFSPRDDMLPIALYVSLLAGAERLGCATFAFGIPDQFKQRLQENTSGGPLCFLLLESRDVPRKNSKKPFIKLNSKNNIYEASGSELNTPLGRWVVETDNRALDLNEHVAFIHLKFLLHDPLGADPVVVTGSANFSEASTMDNDENMIVVRGDRRVADIYFTEFNRLWGHFQFRSVVEAVSRRKPKGGPAEPPDRNWQFLAEDSSWLKDYEPGDLRSKRVDQYVGMAID
jgi:phosphatidylserine/phosphatidylglycerophosphate/cardiolipin synthase-like enzyme